MLVSGDEVAGWTVELLLDDGPMSATFRVVKGGDTAALKVLHLRDPAFSERLMRAAATLIAVEHENLVRVRGIVDVDGRPGVLSDYVVGTDLARWIGRGRRDLAETLRMFHGIVAGLAEAHQAGLVHRNLKPSKVLIRTTGGGEVPLINDFLLGKVQMPEGQVLTQMGTTFGTPQYMPPEQFRSAALVDARGDLFAAGCLLYEMCCGVRPFLHGDLLMAYDAASNAKFEHPTRHRPDLPDPVVTLIRDLLRPEPDDRPAEGRVVLERLESRELWSLIEPGAHRGVDTLVERAPTPAAPAPVAEAPAAPPATAEPAPEPPPPPPPPKPAASPAPAPVSDWPSAAPLPPRVTSRTVKPLAPSQVPTSEAPVRPEIEPRTLDPSEVFIPQLASEDPRRWILLGAAAIALLFAAAALGYLAASG